MEPNKTNNLHFNIKNFSKKTFTKKKETTLLYFYKMDDVQLENIVVKKDLKVTFQFHIKNARNRALKSLGSVINRWMNFKNVYLFCLLHNAFLRSKIEYCDIVWMPCTKELILDIEKFSKIFLFKKIFI